MIHTEFYKTREDGVELYRTFSDLGNMIENEKGQMYSEAIDVQTNIGTYTETDIQIIEELEDSEALDILTGRDTDEPENSETVTESN